MEGVSNEAASIAGQLGLGKLVYFYDDNRITIDGTTRISFTAEDVGDALRGAGLARPARRRRRTTSTRSAAAIDAAKAETERPSLIVVRSHIGYPAPNAVDTAKAHGAPLGEDEVRATKEVLGWDPDAALPRPGRGRTST